MRGIVCKTLVCHCSVSAVRIKDNLVCVCSPICRICGIFCRHYSRDKRCPRSKRIARFCRICRFCYSRPEFSRDWCYRISAVCIKAKSRSLSVVIDFYDSRTVRRDCLLCYRFCRKTRISFSGGGSRISRSSGFCLRVGRFKRVIIIFDILFVMFDFVCGIRSICPNGCEDGIFSRHYSRDKRCPGSKRIACFCRICRFCYSRPEFPRDWCYRISAVCIKAKSRSLSVVIDFYNS